MLVRAAATNSSPQSEEMRKKTAAGKSALPISKTGSGDKDGGSGDKDSGSGDKDSPIFESPFESVGKQGSGMGDMAKVG